jgi:hypothetical protein
MGEFTAFKIDLKEVVSVWTGFNWLMIGCYCEHGNELSNFVRGREFCTS